MDQYRFLSRLLEFEQADFPCISVYLNTEPNETGKKDHAVFLKKQFKEHSAVMEPNSDERKSFEKDGEKIQTLVENLNPSTRGIGIFASSGSGEFFETFEFAVPFEKDRFRVSDKPFLYPIVRLVSQHPRFAVAAADTNSAHIYVFELGKTIERDAIQNVKTNRTEVGGWSQMRYQRHIENFHQQHAKEVVNELEKLVRDERIEHVILSGDETVIIPMLRDEMSKELSEKIIGTLPLNVNTPEHEILEAATELLREKDAEQDKERIATLLEQNYDDGIGVTGVEKTLTALLNGQVQELYINADLDQINYRRNDVRQILKAYEPGEDSDLPDPGERAELIDELLKRAAGSADRIRFIDDPHLLKTVGGVGAILRYQAKGVSNI